MTAGPRSPLPAPAEEIARLVTAGVASRVGAGDTALWPGAARPGWVEAARTARPLVGEIEGLRDQLRLAGQVRVVLAAAGGAGVAAEALSTLDGAGGEPRLVVLDSPDPVQVADALAGDLAATVLVVSAPAGEDTTGVELIRDVVHRAFRAEGLDAAAQTVVVTAPGGPLEEQAAGSIVVLGPADVDGPWAALTAFALVPAGLAGADVGRLLADAAAVRPSLVTDRDDNPALELGALLASAPVVALAGDRAPALVEWAAQLVAGGLGKDGRGPLVVPVEGPDAPEWNDDTVLRLGVGVLDIGATPGAAAHTAGPPAAQMLQWQYAVAVAAHLLGLDPTDRPDATGPMPSAPGEPVPAFVDGGIEAHAGPWLPEGTRTVAEALRALTGTAPPDATGAHLSVHAYLDRIDDASAAVLRPELARRTGLPTFFGWAPRCLPGAGQRDKGGPPGALVCQLTGTAEDLDDDAGTDLLAEHQLAAARADAAALATRGTAVLRLHFTDRVAGLVTLARAVQQL